MPSPLPALRRLSLALKFANKHKPPMASNATTLAQFLTTSKTKYLSDVQETPGKGGDWTVVMGNEAGDLDSVASAIAFAWVQSEVHKIPTIPLIQIDRDDFGLRPENLYALGLAGLENPKEQLLSITDLVGVKPFPSHKFALVDHNCLASTFSSDNPLSKVTAVLDHHEDEGFYKDTANPRIIAAAGSCASHVAGICPPDLPAELATLLICAILIDTNGLKPGGKALEEDFHAAGILSPLSTFALSLPPQLLTSLVQDPRGQEEALHAAQAIRDLNRTLSDKKSDVSHLGGRDLLRRDYKQYSYALSWAAGEPSISAGLSTVPVALASWGKKGKLQEAAMSWMKHQDISILGVLTSFRSGKGKHKREMAWFVREDVEGKLPNGESFDYDALSARLWKGLKGSEELELKKHRKFKLGKLPPGVRARIYDQGNAGATRKVTAPLLKKILEGADVTE